MTQLLKLCKFFRFAALGIAAMMIARAGFAAASLTPIEGAALALKVPEIARVDASAKYVNQTLDGQKTGYLVVFKAGSSAHPESGNAPTAGNKGATVDARQMRSEVSTAKLKLLANAGVLPVGTIDRFPHFPISYVEVSSADELNRLLAIPDISSIHENRMNRPALASSLPMIQQPAVRAFGTPFGNLGAGAAVAVLDTGVIYTDPAFGPCISPGLPAATCKVIFARDIAPDDGFNDYGGHGTNVAAIVAGVAPGAKIISLDVFRGGPDSPAFDVDVMCAMHWVIDNKKGLIATDADYAKNPCLNQKPNYNIVAMNLSLRVVDQTYPSQITAGPYWVIVDLALAANVATVVAAGNDGVVTGISSPAATQGAISVGAVYSSQNVFSGETCVNGGLKGKPACFSNSAPYLTLLAPGMFVTAGGQSLRGTSQAAPHVAGAMAVLRAAFPAENIAQLKARLTNNGVVTLDARNGVNTPLLNLWQAMGSCSYSFSAMPTPFIAIGASGTFTITTAAHCPWALNNTSSWFRTSISSGTGTTIIGYTVDSNVGSGDTPNRSSVITTTLANPASQTITVLQAGFVLPDQAILSSAASLVFPASPRGAGSAPISFTLTNLGVKSRLAISAIAIQDVIGATNADFVYQTGNCIGELAPLSSCSVEVTFMPTAVGNRTAFLKVFSNSLAPTSPLQISLSGLGTASGGEVDPGFGNLGLVVAPAGDNFNTVLYVPEDGSTVVGGGVGEKFLVSKFASTGSLDASFGVGGRAVLDIAPTRSVSVQVIRRDSLGRILAFGTAYSRNVTPADHKSFVVRLLPTGVLDTNFGSAGLLIGTFGTPTTILSADRVGTLDAAAVFPDDRFVIKLTCSIVRFTSAGVLDLSYGTGGYVVTNVCGFIPIVALADGSVLYTTIGRNTVDVNDSSQGIGVSRITPTGTQDFSFGKNGVANGRLVADATFGFATDLAVSADGKILAVGKIYKDHVNQPGQFSSHAVRFAAGGQIDTTFGTNGSILLADAQASVSPGSILAYPDGRFALLQSPPFNPATSQFSISILKSTGQLDESFGVGGSVTSFAGQGTAMAIAGNKIVASYVNYSTGANGLVRFTGPAAFGGGVLALGSRIVGTLSDTEFRPFKNTSAQPITISSASTSDNSSEFVVVGLGTCLNIILAPGGECLIHLKFQPLAVGIRTTTLSIVTSGGTILVGLTGFGTAGTGSAFSLTVTRAGNGTGTVTSTPSGIGCGFVCTLALEANRQVILTATPAPDSEFTGWSGGGCTGVGSCQVNMSATLSVTATFSLLASSLPANVNFAARRVLSGSIISDTGSNRAATKEASEPSHAGNAGGKSVWWTWTAPTAGDMIIDTAGSNFDTLLAVYTGSALGGLSVVAQNDDTTPLSSSVRFTLTQGQTYQIAVDGYAGASGSIALNLRPAPPLNDNFSARFTLNGAAVTTTGQNIGASKETLEPNHAGNSGGKSVWWRWTAPATGPVTIHTIGSTFDTTLGVYTGASVGALSLVAQDDDNGGNLTSSVSFTATAGVIYQLAVDGYSGSSGAIVLHVGPPPPNNDNFSARRQLVGLPTTDTGNNVSASKEASEPNHAGYPGGNSVWWAWTAPVTGGVAIDTIGSTFDTTLGVYTGASVSGLTLVAQDDQGGGNNTSKVIFLATAGVTYQIAVDGYFGATGAIVLNISGSSLPTNDNFSARRQLVGLPTTDTGNNIGASKEAFEPNHAGNPGGHSVWWTWTAPATGGVAIDTIGSTFDTTLGVYTGVSVGALTLVAQNDDSGGNNTSKVIFLATAGVTYQIAVDGYSGATGAVVLNITVANLPPSAPVLTSIVPGAGRATINFSPPASNGGSPITSYTATCISSGQPTRTATGSVSPLTVFGLTGGVAYTCSLTASNGAGTSGASGILSVTPAPANKNIAPILIFLLD